MVNVFAADLTKLYEREVYEKYYKKLPAWRKAKVDQMKTEDGKVQCVGACALGTVLLPREVSPATGGVPCRAFESSVQLLKTPNINLSHSGKYVICAYSTNENIYVGCDVEKIGKLRLKLAKRFFCPEEYDHLIRQKTIEEQTDLFYRYWVLKESFIKTTREGTRRELNSFEIVFDDIPKLHSFVPSEATRNQNADYYYQEYELDHEYKAAVCATENTFSKDIKIVSFE